MDTTNQPKKHFITNYETGDLNELTKEQRDSLKRLLALATPKINTPSCGTIVFFGTAGKIDTDCDAYKELFITSGDII